jgi:hypothetical protein
MYGVGMTSSSGKHHMLYSHASPVLACTFLVVCTSVIDTCTPFTAQDSDHCASGALDGTVKLFDLVNRHGGRIFNVLTVLSVACCAEMLLGAHEKAVRCIEFCEEQGLIYSGSWDTTVKQWDPRVQGATNSIPQAQRVYAMGQCGEARQPTAAHNECAQACILSSARRHEKCSYGMCVKCRRPCSRAIHHSNIKRVAYAHFPTKSAMC